MATKTTATTAIEDEGGELMSLKLVYSVDEVAESLSIGRTLVFQLISDGQLPSLKIGHRRLVARADLEAFVIARRKEVA